jgi:hypothetical protein
MNRRIHGIAFTACGVLLASLCVLALDLFVFRPSGVYSYTRGEAFGFQIGMTKEQAFHRVCFGKGGVVQIRTRQPAHMQDPLQTADFDFTPELNESNYWVLHPLGGNTYLLIFRDGRLYRVLGHIRRFGELETGLSLFEATEDKDVFAGLSAAEIDDIVCQQREWTKVFLD